MSLHDLPVLNATFNGLAGILLTVGFIFIRRNNQTAHRNSMIAALGASALFLAGYLTYHFTVHGVTRFREPAWFRPIYLTLLLSHTVLAAAIVPMIIITLNRALRQQFDRHKVIARWTWPMWMYVSVTGVLIYLLLYQIFPQPKL
jgi:uncharacterized membrane protein YozB (DUF420 family)